MRRPRPWTGRCPWRLALGGSGSVRAVPCAPGGLGAAPCPAAARGKWLPARIRAWPHCDPVAISSVLVQQGLAGGTSRQPHRGVLSRSAVVSLHLPGRVDVIVPDRFQAREGLTSDDVQAGRLVTDNEVLRRRVAGRDRKGSRWRGSTNG